MLRDLGFALRTLVRARGFTLAAVAILALGIGVTTTIFSAIDGLLLRPPPYDAPERIVAVSGENRERGMTRAALDWPDVVDVGAASRTLEAIAVVRPTSVNLAGLADAGRAERGSGARVSADFFRVFGVRPLLGRTFVADDTVSGRERVVVLGEGTWRARLGADPSAVGRAITLDGERYTVIGVMPARFEHPTGVALWIPFVPESFARERGSRYLSAVARLAPGASLDAARAELGGIAARLAAAYPATNAGWGVDVVPIGALLAAELRPMLVVLAGGAACVLLVACANVANLLFARGAARAGELALRRAIGATRPRLVRQLLVESVLLAVPGAAVGALLAAALVPLLRGLVPVPLPAWVPLAVSGRALAFVAALAVAAGLLAGIAPALRLAGGDGHAALAAAGRSAIGTRRSRTQRGIVVGQVALAVALLAAAGLLAASLARLRAVSPGFDAAGVLAARVAPAGPRYADRDAVARFHADVLARVRTLPGVRAAGATGGLPLASGANRFLFTLDGEPTPAPGSEPASRWERITPGYLAALRIPILRGRDLDDRDRAGAPRVALVTESWARTYFPGRDALGRRFRGGDGEWTTIVGVVGDVRHDALEEAGEPTVYTPFAQQPYAEMTLVVRDRCGDCDGARLAAGVRDAVRAVDPGVPVYDVATMREIVARATQARRVSGAVIGGFALLALLLAGAGVYGLMAFQVAQRRREIGVRLALGARRGDVRRLVVGEGVRLAALGVAVGLLVAVAAGRALAGLLYRVRPTDPPTLLAVSAVLVGAAALASWLPARRIARTDPAEVLRAE